MAGDGKVELGGAILPGRDTSVALEQQKAVRGYELPPIPDGWSNALEAMTANRETLPPKGTLDAFVARAKQDPTGAGATLPHVLYGLDREPSIDLVRLLRNDLRPDELEALGPEALASMFAETAWWTLMPNGVDQDRYRSPVNLSGRLVQEREAAEWAYRLTSLVDPTAERVRFPNFATDAFRRQLLMATSRSLGNQRDQAQELTVTDLRQALLANQAAAADLVDGLDVLFAIERAIGEEARESRQKEALELLKAPAATGPDGLPSPKPVGPSRR